MTRLAMFTPGPSFSRADDGTMMFSYQVDASNSIGPRKATDFDKAKYPQDWEIFAASEMMKVSPVSPTTEILSGPVASPAGSMEEAGKPYAAAPVSEKRRPGRPRKAA